MMNKINWNLGVCLLSLISIFYLQWIELEELSSSFLMIPISVPLIKLPPPISLADKAKAITVKILVEEFWGSGILIARQDNTYTVLTNAHVVEDSDMLYQIQTPDGKLHSITTRIVESWFADYDLALLKFVSEEEYQIASLGNNPQVGEKVLAVGFPHSFTNPHVKIAQREGVIWQILPKPMKEGYQVGYSSKIQKGMSGGAVLNQSGEVVAINGMHAYPLWGNPYIYQDGDIPDESILKEMDKYSWAIPIDTFKQLMR